MDIFKKLVEVFQPSIQLILTLKLVFIKHISGNSALTSCLNTQSIMFFSI